MYCQPRTGHAGRALDFLRRAGMMLRQAAGRGQADIHIEPVPCGEREWETEQGRPILDMAREEGTEISIASPD